GNEHSESVQGMGDLVAPEAEDEAGDGRVRDRGERGDIDVMVADEPDFGEFVGRAGEDDGGVAGEPVAGRGPGGGLAGAGVGGAAEAHDGRVEAYRAGQGPFEGLDEDLETVVEGDFPGVLLGFFRAPAAFAGAEELADQEGAVALFEGVELGKGVLDGEA